MTCKRLNFKFIDRGCKDSILLVPGWASDSGIFELLDMPFNYFLPEDILPIDFDNAFAEFIEFIKPPGIHILGWSMGGFIAAQLVSKYPAMFKTVILVSVRKKYETEAIENIKGYIKKNRKAYLYKFYEELFSEKEEENRSWFKMKLFKRYMAEMTPEVLLKGLDYLMRAELDSSALTGHDVTFVHGDKDTIAPIQEARALKQSLPQAKFLTINGACHIPFLRTSMGF